NSCLTPSPLPILEKTRRPARRIGRRLAFLLIQPFFCWYTRWGLLPEAPIMLGEIFGLGPIEIVVLVALGISLFGKYLPQMGRYLGNEIDDRDRQSPPGPPAIA